MRPLVSVFLIIYFSGMTMRSKTMLLPCPGSGLSCLFALMISFGMPSGKAAHVHRSCFLKLKCLHSRQCDFGPIISASLVVLRHLPLFLKLRVTGSNPVSLSVKMKKLKII